VKICTEKNTRLLLNEEILTLREEILTLRNEKSDENDKFRRLNSDLERKIETTRCDLVFKGDGTVLSSEPYTVTPITHVHRILVLEKGSQRPDTMDGQSIILLQEEDQITALWLEEDQVLEKKLELSEPLQSLSRSFTETIEILDGTSILQVASLCNITPTRILEASILPQPANTLLAGPLNGDESAPTFRALATQDFIAPSQQRFTQPGPGIYTTPTQPRRPLYLRVRMVGGGGGGAGGGSVSGSSGGNGESTSFGRSLLTAYGGHGGAIGGGQGGVPGSGTICSPAFGTTAYGGYGVASSYTSTALFQIGGIGGSSFFGGGGAGAYANSAGIAAVTYGSGGGGGSNNGTSHVPSGAGGGAGGYVDALITFPSATYSYSVGAGGLGGKAGKSSFAGGAGGSGYIEVTEYYQ